jgi:hypothetical protein
MYTYIYVHTYVCPFFFFDVFTLIGDVCACVYIRMYWLVYMYLFACSLSSNPIDLCTVITCECSQGYGRTALLWASERGHADTVRVLVELGASLEAFDKVNIHAHALAYTCCIKHVSGMMRMTMIFFSPSPKSDHLIFSFPIQFY